MFYNQPIGENHSVSEIRHIDKIMDVYCLTAPEYGNFALASGVFVNNCGIVCIATPLEAGWEGYVTLEFSNTTPLPAMLFANEGAAQVLFFEGENCFTSYADRGGKYQYQEAGPVLPKM